MAGKSIDQLKKERNDLNRRIRAAERAAEKAARAAFTDAAHELGVWLAKFVGASAQEQVRAIRSAMETDQIRQHLASQVGTNVSTDSATTVAPGAATSVDSQTDGGDVDDDAE